MHSAIVDIMILPPFLPPVSYFEYMSYWCGLYFANFGKHDVIHKAGSKYCIALSSDGD